MKLTNASAEFQAMSPEDRQALQELRTEIGLTMSSRLGDVVKEPPLGDIIAAVTPGMATPSSLKNF